MLFKDILSYLVSVFSACPLFMQDFLIYIVDSLNFCQKDPLLCVVFYY